MGNTKSRNGELVVGHERLDEHNPRYFARVQARNTTSDTPRRWRLRRKQRATTSVPLLSAHSRTAQEQYGQVYAQNYVGSMFSLEEGASQSPKPLVGPLPTLTPLDTSSISTTQSRNNDKEQLSKPTGTPRKAIAKLPSPRGGRIRSPENAASVSSSSATGRSKDYYTDMMEAASSNSRDYYFSGESEDALRSFDAMLPSGVVWAELSRGSKVTCFALSKPDKDSNDPMLLAIGSEDGVVAVVEIYNEASSPRSVSSHGGCAKRHGVPRELLREGKVRCLDFSPDGQWLAVAGDDCAAGLVRLQFRSALHKEPTLNGLEVATELEREDRIYAIQFDPSGSLVAMGGFDGKVTIASVKDSLRKGLSFEVIREVSRSGLVFSLDWSPDGTSLAVAGSDKRCAIMNDSWEVTSEIRRKASIHTVKWSPDGSHVAVGCKDGTVAVVDVAFHEVVSEIVRGQPKNGGEDTKAGNALSWANGAQCQVTSLCWNYDGAFLAISGSDAVCAIVESKTFTPVHEVRRIGSINCVCWGQRVLVVGGDDRAVALLKTGRSTVEETDTSSLSETSDDDISSSGSSVLRSFQIVSPSEWIMREDFRDIDESFAQQSVPDISMDDPDVPISITAVAFSRARKGESSSYLAMASTSGRMLVLSTKDWRVVAKFKVAYPVTAIQFSRKSKFLAVAGGDSVVYILSVSDWQVVKETRFISSINALGFSRSDEYLAVGSSDGLLTLLGQNEGWNIVGEMEERETAVQTLDWSKHHLAVGRSDGSVTIHEVEKVHSNFFVPQAEFSRGDKAISAVAFSVKGKYLAVGGEESKISIYSAKGGWVLCHQIEVANGILDVRWSSTGRYLAYCGKGQPNGCTVIDTLCWSEVDELQAAHSAADENLHSIAWSNDEKFVVFAGSAGVAQVIDTETWKIAQAFKHTGETCQLPSQEVQTGNDIANTVSEQIVNEEAATEAPIASAEGAIRDEPREAVQFNVKWCDIPLVSRFFRVSSDFLSLYEESDPPFCLRVYVIGILMLESHVAWVSSMDPSVTEEAMFWDDGEPLGALLGILQTATDVMTQVLENESTIDEWWMSSTNFELTPKELRRMHAWNEQWRQVDGRAPIVETNLLMTTDELKQNPI